MKAHIAYRTFNTESRREFVRITEDVEVAVRKSGVQARAPGLRWPDLTTIHVSRLLNKPWPRWPFRCPVCRTRDKRRSGPLAREAGHGSKPWSRR